MSLLELLNNSKVYPAYRHQVVWLVKDGEFVNYPSLGIDMVGVEVKKLGPQELTYAFVVQGRAGEMLFWSAAEGKWEDQLGGT